MKSKLKFHKRENILMKGKKKFVINPPTSTKIIEKSTCGFNVLIRKTFYDQQSTNMLAILFREKKKKKRGEAESKFTEYIAEITKTLQQ